MTSCLKNTLREITPPVLWRLGRYLAGGEKTLEPPLPESGEPDAQWYDGVYRKAKHYANHYTVSRYYPLWCVLVDRIARAGVQSVLEVGCGPGQLASFLRDRGISDYCGFDFSEKAISMARSICPELTFAVADALETDLFQERLYDAVVCTEVLEHVERDLDVLTQVKPGVRFFGSVPNSPYIAHVRHFVGCGDVVERYGRCFRDFQVDPVFIGQEDEILFLMEGTKT